LPAAVGVLVLKVALEAATRFFKKAILMRLKWERVRSEEGGVEERRVV
jgi:hypothetical protein